MRDKLAARLARHVAPTDRERIGEFLAELAGCPVDRGTTALAAARQDPILMGDQIRRAWEDFVGAECGAGPVMLVLEDLHWGDLPSVNLIDAALRRHAERPLLVLALASPEVHDLFPGLWAERQPIEIQLTQLTRRAAEQLVREALGPDTERSTLDRVVGLAAGNAFYLEELIRTTY